MYMYGAAELTLVSEKIGQNKYCDIKGLTIVGILISIMIYAALSMIMIIFRNKVPALISDEKALIEGAAKLILPMVLMNLFNPIQTILKYVLLACGKAKSVLYITALINAVVLISIIPILDIIALMIITKILPSNNSSPTKGILSFTK